MGAVFVADYEGSSGFRKRVALKMLRGDRSSPEFAETLRQEAKTAVRLEHPHIAQVYDLSDSGSDPYVVMEYVHGESIASLADAAGSLPYAMVSWIGVCIADALSYAHGDRGDGADCVVHRDLSPQNILISYDGVPKLVDFGIALDYGQPGGEPGPIRGRLPYMPPEQRRGEGVDGRADLYALGVVLYQLAVGAHPWSVAGHEVERPPHPSALRPDFPAALWMAISQATEPARDARPATARELLALLRQCAEDTGGHDLRDDLAHIMTERFAERRREKDRLLTGEIGLDSETEVVGGPADPTPTGNGASVTEEPARRRLAWRWAAAAALVLTGLVIAYAVWQRGDRTAAPVSADKVAIHPGACVIVDPQVSPADHDATWTAARLLGIGFERAGLRPVHGYRAQDERGWTEEGLIGAVAACERAGARDVVRVRGGATGAMALIVAEGAPPRWFREPTLVASALAAMAHLGVRFAEGPLIEELTTELEDRAAIMVLKAREDLLLEQASQAGRDAIAVLAREYPALDGGSIARLILLWWSGDLDEARAPALPEVATSRARALREVIVALAQRDPHRAGELIERILEDRRYHDDALALYLAGEAFVHQGRPAEGVGYLARSLARDPQLSPGIYHIFERRLAEGDTEGVLELADSWDRIEPGGVHAAEYRAHAALGAGDHDRAIESFQDLLRRDRSPSVRLNGARSGLMYSLLLAGRTDEALAYARRQRPALVGPAAVSWVMIEPIVYAIGLDGRDPDLVADWTAATRARLVDDAELPNHWLLRYTMALLDTLAGRADGRARWVPTPPPASIPRSYRFAAHRRLLAALEGRADPALQGVDPGARRLAEALELERTGELERAAEALHGALASSGGGEFDCITAASLARVERRRGRSAEAADACSRVLRPRVPRAYCIAVRRQCAATSQ